MAKNNEYWKKRFTALEDAQNAYSQKVYNQITPAFDRAEKQIQNQIEIWYQRFADNNGVSMQEARRLLSADELKELKWDVKEYIKYGQANAMNQQWLTELENASAKFHISRLEALKLRTQQALEVAYGNELDAIDGMLRHQFTDGYYHSCFELMRGMGVGWDIGQIDEKRLSRILSNPWAADGKTFSDRIWNSKAQMVNDLHQQLTRACLLGKAPDQTISSLKKYLKDKTKNARYQAGRLVMTESAWIGSVAQQQAFNELDVEEYEIVATLDSHTSDICQEMDGKHFPMKDFVAGSTAPPFHVFCRSCTCPYFDDEFANGERIARNEDGETYFVPENMKYPEWKEAFVGGGSKDGLKEIIKSPKIDIITDAKDLSDYDSEQIREWETDYYDRNDKVDLTEDEILALDGYGEGAYEAINAVERFDEGSDEYNKVMKKYGAEQMEKAKETTKHLSSAISKFELDEDIVVHRAVRDASYITGSDNSIEALQDMIGKTYVDDGYVSTSLRYQSKFEGMRDDAVHIEITVPKGSNGAYIDDYVAKSEMEYLINKKQEFYVVDAGERVVQVQKYDFKTRSVVTVDKTERYMKVQLLPDENKIIEEVVEKTIDDCKTIDDVESLVKDKGWFHKTRLPNGTLFDGNDTFSLQGADLESAKSVYRTYEKFYDKFPGLVGELNSSNVVKLASHTEAQCSFGFGRGGISLNTSFYSNYEKFKSRYISEVLEKWSPQGTTCDSVLMHELGHALDDYLTNILHLNKGKYVSQDLRKSVMKKCGLTVKYDVRDNVSQYATKNEQEWFAECFAEWMDSDSPRSVATEFGKQLEELLKGRKIL